MMKPMRAMLVAALLVAAACYGKGEEMASDTPAVTADTTLAGEVRRAAAIANAMTATPDKVDSILTANALTQTQLEAMMFRIARDSVASAEYGRLTQR